MLVKILTTIFILILLDSIYFYVNKDFLSQQVLDVQGTPISLNLFPAFLCYIALAFGINYFILREKKSLLDAFLLGVVIYAVYETTNKAVERARAGKGPTLIECLTYRWLGHVGPSNDLDKGLRSKQELERWMKKCPIKRLEKYFVDYHILPERKLKNIRKQVEKQVEDAVAFARNSPYPEQSSLLEHIFKEECS